MCLVKMKINLSAFSILLILMHNCYAANSKCSENKLDSECSTYCYQVLKPLFQYLKEAHQKEQKFAELREQIQNLEAQKTSLSTAVETQKEFLRQKDNELKLYNNKINLHADLLQSYKAEIEQLKANGKIKTSESITEIQTNEIQSADLKYSKSVKLNGSNRCLAKKTGIQDVTITDIQNFSVYCDSELADSGWTVIQRRQDASVNFDRDWSSYRNGFGNLDGNFFIGLEKLYLLTNEQPHELYIHLKSFENETRFARYNHFRIGNERESYKIVSMGKYSGNAGDSMGSHLNSKFSSHDQDNDEADYNCAKEWLSGWWFKNCAYCNLNGLYRDDKINLQNGLKWNSWDLKIRLSFVQMMIRPVVK